MTSSVDDEIPDHPECSDHRNDNFSSGWWTWRDSRSPGMFRFTGMMTSPADDADEDVPDYPECSDYRNDDFSSGWYPSDWVRDITVADSWRMMIMSELRLRKWWLLRWMMNVTRFPITRNVQVTGMMTSPVDDERDEILNYRDNPSYLRTTIPPSKNG